MLRSIQNFIWLLSNKWHFKVRIAWPQPNDLSVPSQLSKTPIPHIRCTHQLFCLWLLKVKYNTSLSNCKDPWLPVMFDSYSPHEQLWKVSSCTTPGSWSFVSEMIKPEGLGNDLAAHWHGSVRHRLLGIIRDMNSPGTWQMSFTALVHQEYFIVYGCRLCL